jgi:chorismate mutase/prephenate dehydratase
MEIYPGANKISLMLTLPNLPGALFQLMAKISAMGMNVTKLESRPIPGRDFEFLFYFDIDADITAPGMAAFLEEITRELETCQMLGAYAEMP